MLRGWTCLVLILTVTPASYAGAGTEGRSLGERRVIKGVDHYRVTEPLFEGLRVILNYRGESYSPAYIAGISGAAFRIAGPCPCAPTCDAAMGGSELLKLFGYESTKLSLTGPDKTGLPEVQDSIKAEVRTGRPVLVWNAFTTAEWDVVCGFDDAKGEFLGRGSYLSMRTDEYANAAQSRISEASVAPAFGIVAVGKKVGEFEARRAEVAALKEAVAHANGFATTLPGMPSGLRCYDAWIAAYESRGTLTRAKSRDEKQDLGWVRTSPPNDGYPLAVYPSTHRAASDFLKEIAPKYPEARSYLELAAEHFGKEATALEAVRKARGPAEPSEEQCIRIAGYLREARAMYSLGVEEIAAALRKIAGST